MSKPASDNLKDFPLCEFFLSAYITKAKDEDAIFDRQRLCRYEELLACALGALNIRKEELKKRPEFNFDRTDKANFESAVGALRAVVLLHQKGFSDIKLLEMGPKPGADILCRSGKGKQVCCEVKTLTVGSGAGRKPAQFLAEQMAEKLRSKVDESRVQLAASMTERNCDGTALIVVVNWPLHSAVLDQSSYQTIVDTPESDGRTKGIDAFVFVTSLGQSYGFLSDHAQHLL